MPPSPPGSPPKPIGSILSDPEPSGFGGQRSSRNGGFFGDVPCHNNLSFMVLRSKEGLFGGQVFATILEYSKTPRGCCQQPRGGKTHPGGLGPNGGPYKPHSSDPLPTGKG